jgi:AcrR family transcriptional regulator
MSDKPKSAAAKTTVTTTVRKPRGRGHERHEEILQAAKKLFIEHGVDTVSTRRIASEVGISQTALYVYFPTKDAILDALCDDCFKKLTLLFQTDLQQGRNWTDRLRRIMKTYVRFGLDHPDEYRLSFMTPNAHQAEQVFNFDAPIEEQDIGTQCFLMLLHAVQEFLTENALVQDHYAATQCLWAGGHGLVSLMITLPNFPWSEREALIHSVSTMLLNGIANKPVP